MTYIYIQNIMQACISALTLAAMHKADPKHSIRPVLGWVDMIEKECREIRSELEDK